MWSTFWITLERRIHLIFMVANFLLMAYVRSLPGGEALRQHINRLDDCAVQWQAVADYFDNLGAHMERLPQELQEKLIA